MIFAFWMACISDAYGSVYYRHKPVLDDDDYDIDFYTVDPINADVADPHTPMPDPREQLEVRARLTPIFLRSDAKSVRVVLGMRASFPFLEC
jgi:hypothetical protein